MVGPVHMTKGWREGPAYVSSTNHTHGAKFAHPMLAVGMHRVQAAAGAVEGSKILVRAGEQSRESHKPFPTWNATLCSGGISLFAVAIFVKLLICFPSRSTCWIIDARGLSAIPTRPPARPFPLDQILCWARIKMSHPQKFDVPWIPLEKQRCDRSPGWDPSPSTSAVSFPAARTPASPSPLVDKNRNNKKRK